MLFWFATTCNQFPIPGCLPRRLKTTMPCYYLPFLFGRNWKSKLMLRKPNFIFRYAIDYHLSKFLAAQLNDRNNNTRWSHKTVITRGLIACAVLDSKLGEPARTNCAFFNIVIVHFFGIYIILIPKDFCEQKMSWNCCFRALERSMRAGLSQWGLSFLIITH